MPFLSWVSLSGFSSVTCGGLAFLVNDASGIELSETEPTPAELATPRSINALQQTISCCSPLEKVPTTGSKSSTGRTRACLGHFPCWVFHWGFWSAISGATAFLKRAPLAIGSSTKGATSSTRQPDARHCDADERMVSVGAAAGCSPQMTGSSSAPAT
jgi:hypothetical protein